MNTIVKGLGLIFITLIGFLTIVSSGDYGEGDVVAETTWTVMNIREKSMYDKVEEKWGRQVLLPIREQIRLRKVKPDEDAIPFYDITIIIKTINEIKMISSDKTSDSNAQKKYNNKKWDVLFPDWYYKYVDPQKGNFNKKETPTTGFIQKTPPPKKVPPKKEAPKPSSFKSKSIETYTIEDLLPDREYSKIKRLVQDCDESRQLLDNIISSGRPLTYSDRDAIKERYLFCKAMSLTEE